MNFVVIGTDHRFQNSEAGLEGLLRGLMGQRFIEPLEAIAEEHHEKIGESICQRLAHERSLHWYNVDMTTEEKQAAHILEEQRNRPETQEAIAFRLSSDEVREEAWVKKLTESKAGTTLVVCGYVHLEALVKRLRDNGHAVDKRVYLEDVPDISHTGS